MLVINKFNKDQSVLMLLFSVTFLYALTLKHINGIDLASLSSNHTALEHIEPKTIIESNTVKPYVYSPYLGKTYTGFKEAIGFKESRGDYNVINDFGYLGKYQFGKSTLQLIGICNVNTFLNSPELQEKAFLANAMRNKWVLRKDIKRFSGKRVNGILVTESGILAAAHLSGPGNVKKYLRSYGSNNFSDGFGTTVQYYMKKFSGYDTSFIQPDKRAKVSKI